MTQDSLPTTLSGSELKSIRRRLGLSTVAMGRAFGYEGTDATTSSTVRKYENGAKIIPPWIARLAILMDKHGLPTGWTEPSPHSTRESRGKPLP